METKAKFSAEGYRVSNDASLMDITMIHHYLSVDSYWAQNIPLEIVERSIKNSFCFGVYQYDKQVGFGRLVTDKATFAYLADVFILPAHRGKGLSKLLLAAMHADPEMQGLRRWMLGTKDAHELYKQFGWKPLTEELFARFMQWYTPDVYKNIE
jgi:GNAT superfamily N-acetyltransferase